MRDALNMSQLYNYPRYTYKFQTRIVTPRTYQNDIYKNVKLNNLMNMFTSLHNTKVSKR